MLDNQQETQFEEIHLRTGYSKGPCLDCVYADFRNKNEKMKFIAKFMAITNIHLM